MATPNHTERIRARKVRCARQFGYCFLAGVNQVGIFRAFQRKRPHAEHAVFGLEDHFHAVRNMVRNQGGNPDAQVHIKAVAQFQSNAFHDALAPLDVLLLLGGRHAALRRTVLRSIRFSNFSPRTMRFT
jgi:hypothetical protein